MKGSRLLTALGPFLLSVILARATSNYIYGSDEYDTVIGGISPNGKYAIATHGSSANYGYDGFRVFLIDNLTGKKIGPLLEVSDNLDTGADAFGAKWSADSGSVFVVYRIDRHQPLQAVEYRIAHGRAYPATLTHVDADANQSSYWQTVAAGNRKSPKIFGTPRPHQYDQ